MPRFYLPFDFSASQDAVVLDADSVHHAMRVLRLRQDDAVEVFNGKGLCVKGNIRFAEQYAEVIPQETYLEPRGLNLTLLQSLVANEKTDWIMEKACELGYAKIVVFPAERCEIRLNAEKVQKRLERWRKIVISACKQCGENFLPEIVYTPTLSQAATHARGLKFLLSPQAPFDATSQRVEAVSFAVGPEGGFSPAEFKTLTQCEFVPLRLGARVLRTETAAIAAASFARTLWGDFR